VVDQMKFGLYGLHRGVTGDPEALARRAGTAEDAGFEGLWVGDHVALPAGPGDAARLEAVVAVTFLAAVTSRIRLALGLLVLPQRQPVLLAKQLASLDVLAQGRLTVGVGVGYVETELQALGVPMAERGARTDEFLTVMKLLWAGSPSFGGRFVSYDDVVQAPRPVQHPHPPIVVGGHSPAAFRRAIRRGQGWYGWQLSVDEAAHAVADLQAAAAREERPAELGPLEISITPPQPIDLDMARRYADCGVHRLVLQPHRHGDAAIDHLIATTADDLIGQL
jgi:probable F420-dependent oxidoreductase